MTKCVKILCLVKITKTFTDAIQNQARLNKIEGLLQPVDSNHIKIIACGTKEHIDSFVDFLYKTGSTKKPFSLEVEPFLKDKDYRGVFRIVA